MLTSTLKRLRDPNAPPTCNASARKAVQELIDEHTRFLDEQQAKAKAEGRIELTDGQLKVCNEVVKSPHGVVHAYGVQQSLRERYPEEKVLSEPAIGNILARLAELGLVERVTTLRPNRRGPARQEYRLIDKEKADRIISAETKRRLQLIESLYGAPVSSLVANTDNELASASR